MQSQESNSLTVYGRPGCMQCRFTTRELDKLKIPYVYVDISINVVAEGELKDMGFSSLPVVVSQAEKWAGFKVDKIRSINNGQRSKSAGGIAV